MQSLRSSPRAPSASPALTDIDGTLCVEYQRDELKLYIQTEGTPLVIVYKPLSMCIDGLVSGAYQAVLSDRPVLNWIVNMCAVPPARSSRIVPARKRQRATH